MHRAMRSIQRKRATTSSGITSPRSRRVFGDRRRLHRRIGCCRRHGQSEQNSAAPERDHHEPRVPPTWTIRTRWLADPSRAEKSCRSGRAAGLRRCSGLRERSSVGSSAPSNGGQVVQMRQQGECVLTRRDEGSRSADATWRPAASRAAAGPARASPPRSMTFITRHRRSCGERIARGRNNGNAIRGGIASAWGWQWMTPSGQRCRLPA